MKSEAFITTPPFAPVVLTITIESQNELDALGALFNVGPIDSALVELGCKNKIWETLEKAGANISTEVIKRVITKACRSL